ncbi:MAG: carboxylesterase family protein [Bryobacteraceae bacterium]|nr:carboxylesterase family protein [Bryobacteraceae bacterium]
MKFRLSILALTPLLLFGAELVKIDTGSLEGAVNDGVRVFKGIPYAAPPVGELRWKAPRPAARWQGDRKALEFGPGCWQPRNAPNLSEDCLYLNVYTPARDAKAKLPVMFWIHGGAFVSGSGSIYRGEKLAQQGVVLVTINYRLGPMGFFSHPLLSKESPRGVSGNYGLLDMIAALEWTKRNIARFGGDPSNVTIFGESAGAAAVHYLMGSPLSKGLFAKAIMESNPSAPPRRHLRERWYDVDPGETVGERVAAELKAGAAAALRAVEPKAVMAAMQKPGVGPSGTLMPLEPVIDGYVVPGDMDDIFEQGRQHKVPLILGANSDEGNLAVAVSVKARDALSFKQIVSQYYPRHADEIAALYPADTAEQYVAGMRRLSGDRSFVTAARWIAARHAKVAPVYLYYFSYVASSIKGKVPGAAHAAELPFVFQMPMAALGVPQFSPEDLKVAQAMSSMWAQFARSGNPNPSGSPVWPAYKPDADEYFEFGETLAAKKGLHLPATSVLSRVHDEMRAAKLPAAGNGK